MALGLFTANDRDHNYPRRLRGHKGDAADDGWRGVDRVDGLIRIWLDRKFVDRLEHMGGPRETYSDVILRLAEASS